MSGGFGLIGKGGNATANVDSTLQIWGLYHLIGSTVSVLLLGLDLGDFTVATDGSVTVSLVATVNQTAAWSAAQLIAADLSSYGESSVPISVKNGGSAVQVTVPIVIGVPYVAQGQRLRAVAADDTRTPGPALGLERRGNQFAALMQNVVEVRFGTLLTPTPYGGMLSAKFTDDAGTAITDGTMFSGVYWDSLTDDYTFDSMFCWQSDRPYPCTVVSTATFVEIQER